MIDNDFYTSVYKIKKEKSVKNRQNLDLSKRILLWFSIFLFSFFFCGTLTFNVLARIEFINEILSEDEKCTIEYCEKDIYGECLYHSDGLDNLGIGFVCLLFLVTALFITLILSSLLTMFIFKLIDHKTIFT